MEPTSAHLDTDDSHHLSADFGLSTTRSDRTIHAIATLLLGVAVGGIFIATRNSDPNWLGWIANAAFVAVVVGAQEWIDRATRTTPRHARRWSTMGIAGSMLVALTVVLPWLNWSEQTEPVSTTMQLVAAIGIAIPCWIAALVIYRDPQ